MAKIDKSKLYDDIVEAAKQGLLRVTCGKCGRSEAPNLICGSFIVIHSGCTLPRLPGDTRRRCEEKP